MSNLEQLESELKQFIIDTLALEDISAEEFESEMLLFGDDLGLDSIDALELGVALQKRYSIKIDASSNKIQEHFMSVKSLAAFIDSQLA